MGRKCTKVVPTTVWDCQVCNQGWPSLWHPITDGGKLCWHHLAEWSDPLPGFDPKKIDLEAMAERMAERCLAKRGKEGR